MILQNEEMERESSKVHLKVRGFLSFCTTDLESRCMYVSDVVWFLPCELLALV